jgi:hypothetical protein
MTEVKVAIKDNDKMVAAMVRALAFAIQGRDVVSGQSQGRLELLGFLTFPFRSDGHAQEFREAVSHYLGIYGAVAN